MCFDISDFLLRDIIYTAKGNIENDYFKVTIENVDYPALISRVGTALMEISILCMKSQVNDENPIEKRIIEYNNIKKEEGHDFLFEKYGNDWDVDFFNPEKFFFRPNLNYISQDYNIEFADVNEKTNDFLNWQMQVGNIVFLSSTEILYKDLENPNFELESKFRKFIHEKCIKEYNNDNELQNTLIEVNNKRIEDETEKEKHMQVVREKEREIQEFNDNLEVPERKNLNDYNIGYH